ncbi:hypothetical protein DWX72_01430 [Ruminococcus sp. AF21-11]|mgnify:CR=1 FL=1|nr:hypothetical protein DWX72_01430 [Ruminococcus sp. AF21-11]
MKVPRWLAEGLFYGLLIVTCQVLLYCVTVEFIELLGGQDGEIQPEIYGIKAFQVDANELEQVLCGHNGADVDDSEEDSRAYRKISVGIYRENYEDRWETIGLGITDYYQ